MIYLGADHGGFTLKEKIKHWLTENSFEYEDLGASRLDPEDDYPDFALKVALQVSKNADTDTGVLMCRSGGGMVITANKVKSIRAVFVFDEKSALHAKEHNNANVISFAADWTTEAEVFTALNTFLHASFSNLEKRKRRVDKMDAL